VELIVVDNASKDGTRRVVEQFRSSKFEVRYVFEAKRGKGNAYNAGIAAAHSDILLFTDDDVRPADGWLLEHVAAYSDANIAGVQGRIELDFEAPPPDWIGPVHRSLLAEMCPSDEPIFPYPKHLVGANMSFRRSIALQVGPFNPLLGPGRSGFWDESEFTIRLFNRGYQLKYCPGASVKHMISADRLKPEYFKDAAYRLGVSSYIVEGIGTHKVDRHPFRDLVRSVLRNRRERLKAVLRHSVYDCTQDHLFYLMQMGATWAYFQGMKRLTERYSS
jgi:glycosyltransferase involved in cell wall biosynthesis